ncbi:MAG TPA: sigma 54-interacting transcriptional regulator [Vicinamibacterales bacterium]|nr:sigma 54-interacting transcriptional regulator [Vicinamibacterales bacterium]
MAALAEMFDVIDQKRPSLASLWGPPGAGRRTIVAALARAARLKGFVPVASRLLGSRYASLWPGRSLFVIHDERAVAAAPWRGFLSATTRTPLPHALLLVGEQAWPSVDGIGLRPVAIDDLVRAVVPTVVGSRFEDRVRRCAVESHGRPGRFVRLLWPDWVIERAPDRRRGTLRAAEHPAIYGDERAVEVAPAPRVARGSDAADDCSLGWPSPGELESLRTRAEEARGLLARGRHAAALRQLRHACAAVAGGDAWTDAAAGSLAIAGALLARGRARDALATIEAAREYVDRTGDEALARDAAILGGEARIDLARFDEAEAVLGAAIAAAVQAGDVPRRAAASVGLARCLFWRGQHVDADAVLGRAPDGLSAVLQVRRIRLQARIEIGRGDVATAMAHVAALRGRLDTGADPGLCAGIACTAAFIHLSVGDLDAAIQEAAEAVTAARAAHDPVRIVRARLIAIEAERRRDRAGVFERHLARLQRIRLSLPPLLRARVDLASALAAGGASPPSLVRRHVSDSGIPSLALYGPGAAKRAGLDPAVDGLLDIVRACQTADDEAIVLKDVCGHVRRQLNAVGVSFIAAGAPPHARDAIAADGARVESAIAERAVAATLVIRPHRREDRIEGAAPVVYGGRSIGALAARWSIGSTYDADRAANVLAMAATAAAPMLGAALAQRARHVPPEGAPVASLLGMAPVMARLRQAVSNAGVAPFCVLIVGESGSGKELVARAIHRGSPRAAGPFCAVNCAALPDDLLESELFGHARGAFTGAVGERAGVFEEAHGGTLFLDEIGELSSRAQAKILRVIQESEIRRVGENVPRRVDARLVAATNRDLTREVEAGRFRLDLMYRLDVIRISVPPLRERAEDVGLLAAHFWAEAAGRVGSRAVLAPATLAALSEYPWPGNVRELQNVLASLAVRSPKRGLVPPTALPPQFSGGMRTESWRLVDARRTFEERFVRAALARSGGHRSRAASELGVSTQGFTKLLARLGISD